MPESAVAYGHRGTRAVQRMVEYAPATGGLALWVQHRDVSADDGAATQGPSRAAPLSTDGMSLRYAPGFESLPLAEQAGLVAHEVLHIALRHPQRYLELQQLIGDADLQLFNICADAIVNSTLAHLSWLELEAGAVTLERLLVQALSIDQAVEKALLEWDVERLYRAIDDRAPSPAAQRETGKAQQATPGRSASSASAQGQSAAQPRSDGPRSSRARLLGGETQADLRPEPLARAAPEAEAEKAREWSERLQRAHAGDGEFSMLRTLIADLPRSRTPWEQVLRTVLARSLSKRAAVSWSRPARSYIANQGRAGPGRRLPWEPGTSHSQAVPRLVLVVDVSGSIDEALMQRFAREVEAIVRRLEAALVLVLGDDRVRRVTQFEAGRCDLRDLRFSGGGGTDFTPLLQAADEHRPDIGIVLTDLDGPARFRPRWPVVWAVPETHAQAVQPFGRKLALR